MARAHTTRRGYQVAVALLLATGLAATAGAATLEKTVSGTYDLPAGRELAVRNVNGDIVLGVWDRDEVRVVAHKRARGKDDKAVAAYLEALSVRIDRSDELLAFEVDYPKRKGGVMSWFSFDSVGGDVDFEITAPRHALVELATVNGGLQVADLAGRLSASTVNGRISMSAVGGEVDASTVNGGIHVAFRDVAPSGVLELSTVNGSITMEAPEDLRATVDVRTTNGSVASDLPLVEEGSRSRTRLVGSLNGGGATIRLRTTNGSVRLRGLDD